MRLRGSFTVEATLVFAIVFFLIARIIVLDFYLHDQVVSDSSRVLAAMRYKEVNCCNYNAKTAGIDLDEIVKSPVLGDDDKFIKEQKQTIKSNMKKYYGKKRFDKNNQQASTKFTSVIDNTNNAMLIRATGRVVQLIGGQNGS